METLSIEDYEKLIDKIISGRATPQEVSLFAMATPILPILTKMGILKNKAEVDVIVTDDKGHPVSGVSVLLNGIEKITDASGLAKFEFPFDVPPGVIILRKDTTINKIPFQGAKVGEKVTVTGLITPKAEMPIAIGQTLKEIIDTHYKWQLIKDIEKSIMQPELAKFPQIGVLKRKNEYEYEVYVPVPVHIKIPPITFQPVVGGMPVTPTPPTPPPTPPPAPVPTPTPPSTPTPPPVPETGTVVVNVIPKQAIPKPPYHGAPPISPIRPIPPGGIRLLSLQAPPMHYGEVTVYVDTIGRTGGFGKYTFRNIPAGTHVVRVLYKGREIMRRTITLSPGETETITVRVPTVPPHIPPTPPHIPPHVPPHIPPHLPPTPPAPSPGRVGGIRVIIRRGAGAVGAATILIDEGKYGRRTITSGSVLFRNIPEGLHTVKILVGGKPVKVYRIHVYAGRTAVVSYTIPGGAPIGPGPTPGPIPGPSPIVPI